MNQKKQKKNKIKEFFKSIGVFVGKGVLTGKWEVKFTWRF